MKHLRAQLTGLVPAVAALFALGVAVPRAGLYYHEHAGSDRAHIHADDSSAIAELLDEYLHGDDHEHGPHTHQHIHAAADPPAPDRTGASRAAVQRDSGPGTGHWHQEDRFHRAVISGAPFIADATRAGAARQFTPALTTHLAALDRRARGPPHPALS